MNNIASIIASYVVNAVWQVPLLAATGWLVSRLLRQLAASIEHRVWVAVLCASVLLPLARPWNFAGLAAAASAHSSTAVRLLAQEPSPSPQAAWLTLPSAVIAVVAGLYLLALLFFLVRFSLAVLSTVRLMARSNPLELEGPVLQALNEASRTMGVRSIRILSSTGVTGPATLWVGGPVLLMPEGFLGSTPVQDFRAAIAHECAHIRRQDFMKNLFYEAFSLVAAFHPVTWLVKAQIAQTREMTCDAMAVEAVGGRRVYVDSLLRLASSIASGPAAANPYAIGIFDANILERRIMTLRAKRETVSGGLRCGLLFAGSLCMLLAIAGGASAAVGLSSGRSSSAVSAAQESKPYKIGGDVSAPVVKYAADPEYPASEKKKGKFEGKCLVGLVVDTSGMPQRVHVVRPLSKDFDAKALEAVEAYRFKPAQKDGKPVPVEMLVEINFQEF